ncbi:hypothetical protein OS493_034804 [Desmophyllum pertusum]|uniref:Uncharacterized protein n=1 Tax=Desmophyllum pertusum TaxID=174260 RepID=A0A9W9YIK8_9CNID|nr:hypothetical protein OS493_034804 [Desmophyllum pertusum]
MNMQVCRVGVRRCYLHNECGRGNVCKNWICQKKECTKHTDCPDNQACEYPGICKNYEAYCYQGYDNYCKYGYICINKRCTKRECNDNRDCKLGDHCVTGFCKPQPGFCSSDSECTKDQCCAKRGNTKYGVCKGMTKPGRNQWCPLQQNSAQVCPCVPGYVCQMKTNSVIWGKCVATDGGSGSGSGSGFLTLITLAVVIHGEAKVEEDNGLAQDYIPCGNYYCDDGFYCHSGECQPKRRCSHHSHCPTDQYCDTYKHACRVGARRCYSQWGCGSGSICKGGICQKRECTKHTDCPEGKACEYPPGICKNYQAYCYQGYDNYCKQGYVCVNNYCKKRECNGNYNCKLGDHCVGGFCKPQVGFCSSDSECTKDQCCAKAGNNKHGVCKGMTKPGRNQWCPLQQSLEACPCVPGHVCQMKTNSVYWGKCVATDGGSGSGSGSGDF